MDNKMKNIKEKFNNWFWDENDNILIVMDIFLKALMVYAFIAYIINIFQLFSCDFQGPWKEEIIHAVGVFLPFLSTITIWF